MLEIMLLGSRDTRKLKDQNEEREVPQHQNGTTPAKDFVIPILLRVNSDDDGNRSLC